MKKKPIYSGFGITLILILFINSAFAGGLTPFADTVFSSAEVSLSTKMNASFTARTKSSKAEIKVTECVLQIKSGGTWRDEVSLTPPSKIATNTGRYSAAKDYSSSCSSGNTYRIKAIFDADGHTKTAYSNSVSY